MTAEVASLAFKRNGSNAGLLRGYTSTGSVSYPVTFSAVLSCKQEVPAGNAGFGR
jgi:hypothetical protein